MIQIEDLYILKKYYTIGTCMCLARVNISLGRILLKDRLGIFELQIEESFLGIDSLGVFLPCDGIN